MLEFIMKITTIFDQIFSKESPSLSYPNSCPCLPISGVWTELCDTVRADKKFHALAIPRGVAYWQWVTVEKSKYSSCIKRLIEWMIKSSAAWIFQFLIFIKSREIII